MLNWACVFPMTEIKLQGTISFWQILLRKFRARLLRLMTLIMSQIPLMTHNLPSQTQQRQYGWNDGSPPIISAETPAKGSPCINNCNIPNRLLSTSGWPRYKCHCRRDREEGLDLRARSPRIAINHLGRYLPTQWFKKEFYICLRYLHATQQPQHNHCRTSTLKSQTVPFNKKTSLLPTVVSTESSTILMTYLLNCSASNIIYLYPLHLLVNIRTVNGACAHFPLIFGLKWNKIILKDNLWNSATCPPLDCWRLHQPNPMHLQK